MRRATCGDARRTPARQAYDAIEARAEEVATDERTRQVKQALSAGVYLEDGAAL